MRNGESTTLVLVFLLVMAVLAAAAWLIVRDAGPTEARASDVRSSGLLRAFGIGPVTRVPNGARPEPAAPPASAPAAQQPVDTAASEPAEQAPPPESAAVDRPLEAGDRARITGTDSVGVVLRSAPREDARLPRGLLEGTTVTVLSRAGEAWVQVKPDNGPPGWVPPQYVERLP